VSDPVPTIRCERCDDTGYVGVVEDAFAQEHRVLCNCPTGRKRLGLGEVTDPIEAAPTPEAAPCNCNGPCICSDPACCPPAGRYHAGVLLDATRLAAIESMVEAPWSPRRHWDRFTSEDMAFVLAERERLITAIRQLVAAAHVEYPAEVPAVADEVVNVYLMADDWTVFVAVLEGVNDDN
jgi:hypothetical protein